MEWIKFKGQRLPQNKNLIYAYCNWSPYQVLQLGRPKYYTSTVYRNEWYESLIAYAIVEDYVPDLEDDAIITAAIRREYNTSYKSNFASGH